MEQYLPITSFRITECGEGEWMCDSGDQCVQQTQLCDRRYNCLDHSDQTESANCCKLIYTACVCVCVCV